jgi:hypothetical protein
MRDHELKLESLHTTSRGEMKKKKTKRTISAANKPTDFGGTP